MQGVYIEGLVEALTGLKEDGLLERNGALAILIAKLFQQAGILAYLIGPDGFRDAAEQTMDLHDAVADAVRRARTSTGN
jgi:hypothetical protein